ncbi:hypothetical protein SAMN02927924_00409 [Sphingobium faniae]|nr:hypothetical protein SAMN02927924_00409 [Sphingobium faniae]
MRGKGAETGSGTSPAPSGPANRFACGVAGDRAFSTTLVVAGLKADPVNLLEGRPSGAMAHSNATHIAIHKVAKKSRRPFPAP